MGLFPEPRLYFAVIVTGNGRYGQEIHQPIPTPQSRRNIDLRRGAVKQRLGVVTG